MRVSLTNKLVSLPTSRPDCLSFEHFADFRRTLTQIPPAYSLRFSLIAKLASILNLPPNAPVLESCGRIRNSRDFPDIADAAPGAVKPHLFRNLTGHCDYIYSVAMSEDGKKAISSCWDGSVKIWEVETGRNLRTYTHQFCSTLCVVFCPGDKWAVSAGGNSFMHRLDCPWTPDRAVHVWDVETGTKQHTLMGHRTTVTAVDVSSDGFMIASASGDKTIKLWDKNTGENKATLRGHSSTVTTVVFHPDGEMLASGSTDCTIKLWNVSTEHPMRTLDKKHNEAVTQVVFTPDGQRLASSSMDKSIIVWDLRSGEEIISFTEHTDCVISLAMFPNGLRIVSGSDDKTVRIWNLLSGTLEHTLSGHKHSVTSVAVSRDGKTLVSGSWDKTVKVWELRNARRG